MNFLSFSLLSLFFWTISHSAYTTSIPQQQKKSSLLRDMKAIKHVTSRKEVNRHLFLFSRVSNYLEKSWDQEVIGELGRLLELVFKIDRNYYVVVPFSNIILRDKDKFLSSLKTVISEEAYQELLLSVDIFLDEHKHGNG